MTTREQKLIEALKQALVRIAYDMIGEAPSNNRETWLRNWRDQAIAVALGELKALAPSPDLMETLPKPAMLKALAPSPDLMETLPKPAIDEIAAERMRQVEEEGWTAEHDDSHTDESLALAAACYADPGPLMLGQPPYPARWPLSWSIGWWKPKDRRCDLVRAGALIVAEIERLDRLAASMKTPPILAPSTEDDGRPKSPCGGASAKVKCAHCDGTGKVTPFLGDEETCDECNGAGQMPADPSSERDELLGEIYSTIARIQVEADIASDCPPATDEAFKNIARMAKNVHANIMTYTKAGKLATAALSPPKPEAARKEYQPTHPHALPSDGGALGMRAGDRFRYDIDGRTGVAEPNRQPRAYAAMKEALKAAVRIAEEARKEWDAAPEGMRAGKLLIALAGGCPGYRRDIDEIHAALALAEGKQ